MNGNYPIYKRTICSVMAWNTHEEIHFLVLVAFSICYASFTYTIWFVTVLDVSILGSTGIQCI